MLHHICTRKHCNCLSLPPRSSHSPLQELQLGISHNSRLPMFLGIPYGYTAQSTQLLILSSSRAPRGCWGVFWWTYAGLHNRVGSQGLGKLHEQIPQIDHDGARAQTFNICRQRRPNCQAPTELYQLVRPTVGCILVSALGQEEYRGPLQAAAYEMILQRSQKSKALSPKHNKTRLEVSFR